MNTALAADLTEIERKLNSAAGIEGGGVEDVVDQLASVDVRLPPAIQGGPDTVVTLLLQNVGGVTAELKLRYPTESELQIEQWADKGEPTAIITHECHACVPRVIPRSHSPHLPLQASPPRSSSSST